MVVIRVASRDGAFSDRVLVRLLVPELGARDSPVQCLGCISYILGGFSGGLLQLPSAWHPPCPSQNILLAPQVAVFSLVRVIVVLRVIVLTSC